MFLSQTKDRTMRKCPEYTDTSSFFTIIHDSQQVFKDLRPVLWSKVWAYPGNLLVTYIDMLTYAAHLTCSAGCIWNNSSKGAKSDQSVQHKTVSPFLEDPPDLGVGIIRDLSFPDGINKKCKFIEATLFLFLLTANNLKITL